MSKVWTVVTEVESEVDPASFKYVNGTTIISSELKQESISWGELAELTHATQVERFNFCMCEDNEGQENPYTDCPKTGE